jgi:hypothetical protein
MIRRNEVSLGKDSSGTISLEASLVFPWILLLTFLLLLFSLLVSQGSLQYYSSSILAERTAFAWSNSSKDMKTGAYPPNSYDGVYWRLQDDGLVRGLFGQGSGERELSVNIPSEVESEEDVGSSPTNKLRRSGNGLSSLHRSESIVMSYRNIGVRREVTANQTSTWIPEPLVWMRGEEKQAAEVSALVVEPVESIRTFDLVRDYAAKMSTSPEGASTYRTKAASVLRKFGL